jgi:hypothetical protein
LAGCAKSDEEIAQCLSDKGQEATVSQSSQGDVEWDGQTEDDAAYQEAAQGCR